MEIKKIIGLVVIILLSSYAPIPDDSIEAFIKINNEVLANSKAYETLGEASKKIGHRLTGSRNGKRAEDYAFDLLKGYGFEDVEYMPFEVEAWMRDTVSLVVVPNKSDNFREVPVVALAHSPVESRVRGKMVDVGNGLEEDFERLGDKIKGNIVVANIGLIGNTEGKKNLHRSEKTALAIKYGATGIIMVNVISGNILLTGTASVTGSLISIPAVCVSWESGIRIRKWINDENLVAYIDMRNFSRAIKARNIVATIKGSGRLAKEKIIVGGHLDSWDLATGAIDNGIGSFAVIDIARTLKTLNLKTKRTIQFVLFMGEEQGLLGSRAMVKQWTQTKEIEKIKCMINLDMANNPKGINAMGREEWLPFLNEIGESIKKIDSTYTNIQANQAALHSDHQPFMLQGVPVILPAGNNFAPNILGCYHANCDRFNLVNKTEIQNTVRFTAMVLYALATVPKMPVVKLDDNQTQTFLEKQGLKRELIIGKDWRWEEPTIK